LLKLIINADDFGLTKGCNIGIIKAMKEGIVTNTTVMINMPHAQEGIELAKQNDIIQMGLHLNLTCGRPVLDAMEIPSLVDEDGNFYRRPSLLVGKMNIEDVERELRSQIKKFKTTGLSLTHMDSHHHSHMYPEISQIAAKLAKEEGVPLRSPNQDIKRLLDQKGVVTTDYFTIDFYDKGATIDSLKKTIENHHEGVLEIMCHPAYLDQDLFDISSYNSPRALELEVLTSQKVKTWIEGKGIKLIGFEDLRYENGKGI
jgi:chitin disaccharide deacetylase